MATSRRLSDLVAHALASLETPPGPLTVALSGGADSAALAYLLQAREEDLDTLHVDHGYPASERLEEAATAIAGRLGVDLEVVRVEVGDGSSPEDQARRTRYEVFDAWRGPLLTAHTLDDNAETIIINLLRGSGADGLSGIPVHRPPVTWRPMLGVTRSETREIATLAELPFFDDPMNEDPALTRNRVRRQVIPIMRELNPQVERALARAADNLGRDSELLDSLVPSAGRSVATSVVLTLPRPLADRVLRRMLAAADIGPTSKRVRRMWEVASGVTERHDLAGGHAVVRRGAMLEIV